MNFGQGYQSDFSGGGGIKVPLTTTIAWDGTVYTAFLTPLAYDTFIINRSGPLGPSPIIAGFTDSVDGREIKIFITDTTAGLIFEHENSTAGVNGLNLPYDDDLTQPDASWPYLVYRFQYLNGKWQLTDSPSFE